MKLATLAQGGPDGTLIVVSRDNRRYAIAGDIAPTMQHALDRWATVAPQLRELATRIDDGHGQPLSPDLELTAPLPRAWQWLDASAFPTHGERMEAALNVSPAKHDAPLMYQGLSHKFYGPHADIPFGSEALGIDFEGEFAVITGAVPMGASLEQCQASIRLVVLLNDWSLRALAGREMATGFGWIQAKPPCSVAPVAVAPDALGDGWRDGRVALRLKVWLDGTLVGDVDGAEMGWSFAQLIEHGAATRPLCAGTIVGSGTVSNRDIERRGYACITEQRAHEMIHSGEARTPYLSFGQRVRMEVEDAQGHSVFGALDQQIVQATGLEG